MFQAGNAVEQAFLALLKSGVAGTSVRLAVYPVPVFEAVVRDFSNHSKTMLMKARFLDRSVGKNESITLQEHGGKCFKKLWHYHPELELMTVLEGAGSIFVGDSVESFEPGTIVLIGKNLPHIWYNDKAYFQPDSELKVRSHSIHFNEDFACGFLQIPEMAELQQLLVRTSRGIKFFGKANETIIRQVSDMFSLPGYERILSFIGVLNALSRHSEYSQLSSLGYINSFKGIQDTKIMLVHEYIMNNFKEDILLKRVADIANMNASAFSRYFSGIQKKTLTQFVNEIRIGYACKLMMDGDYNITQACYESGFRNLSNFNKQFLKLKKMQPSYYLKLYKNNSRHA